MIKPRTFDGVVYDVETLLEIRKNTIQLRDNALKLGDFDTALKLSHTIASLSIFIEELQGTWEPKRKLEQSMKVIYYVITSNQRWGRGFTEKEALTNAGIILKKQADGLEHHIYKLILNSETTPEEIKQLAPCWSINDFGNLVKAEDCTPEDLALIDKRVIGWCETDKRGPKPRHAS